MSARQLPDTHPQKIMPPARSHACPTPPSRVCEPSHRREDHGTAAQAGEQDSPDAEKERRAQRPLKTVERSTDASLAHVKEHGSDAASRSPGKAAEVSYGTVETGLQERGQCPDSLVCEQDQGRREEGGSRSQDAREQVSSVEQSKTA